MWVRNLVAPALGAAMAILASTCGTEGCTPLGPSTADAYTMELQECVAKAKNLAESRACREKVDEKYGVCRTFPDACLPGQR
jgi:hypothetical protein